MSASRQASSLCWRKYYEKEISFRGECLVNGEELASGKLVLGVIQKIAVGVVC